MRLFIPYNEILPKRAAHDLYLFHLAASLAHFSKDITLLSGRGGLPREALFSHYNISPSSDLKLCSLPILRKNNFLNLSWNLPFFRATQARIQKERPDALLLSVSKQAAYHLSRRVKGVKYIYEAHQLSYIPGKSIHLEELRRELALFSAADLLVVTTEALRQLLLHPPYAISTPIQVIPLAVQAKPLPPPHKVSEGCTVGYVGQLYKGKGLSFLLRALKETSGITLKIVGGTAAQQEQYRALTESLGIAERVHFAGFCPPAEIARHLEEVDCFVAPFPATDRMPYVAHTKIYEYATWGRPMLLPDLPIVEEHLPEKRGVLLFTAESIPSLAGALERCKERNLREQLQAEMSLYQGAFSWEKRAQKYHEVLNTLLGH